MTLADVFLETMRTLYGLQQDLLDVIRDINTQSTGPKKEDLDRANACSECFVRIVLARREIMRVVMAFDVDGSVLLPDGRMLTHQDEVVRWIGDEVRKVAP